MAVLIGMSEEVKGKNLELGEETITIGRKEDNTLSVDNPTISSHHCKIEQEGALFKLVDLGSTNGTRVNSQDIEEAVLKPKDIIQVGSVEFMYDGEHVSEVESTRFSETQVEVAPGPAAAPATFNNISPFGARKQESKGLWYFLFVVLGLAAIGALVWLLVYLMF